MNVRLQPRTLRWARERAGLDEAALAKKLGTKPERVLAWEETGELSLKKVELLAARTYTPFGQLFLPEPPEEKLPIPDFRTVRDAPLRRPSPDLLETVHQMQRRQAWMRDFLIEEGEPPRDFVGSRKLTDDPLEAAADMRRVLGCANGWAAREGSWSDACAALRQKAEEAGVLVVINGVVGNNNTRKLNPDEFRGFALVDGYAPLVFVNGADFKSAQIFTLAHELAHLWIGKDGVSNFEALQPTHHAVEVWCNAAAAEFLVPADELRERWPQAERYDEPFLALARRFKVSPIVAARRALDLGLISSQVFFAFYEDYAKDERRLKTARPNRGNFWNTQNVRVGRRFGSAVVRSAREGRLLYRDAFNLTGLHGATFDRFAEQLGFRPR